MNYKKLNLAIDISRLCIAGNWFSSMRFNILNFSLLLHKNHFSKKILFCLEKHYFSNDITIVEYFTNGKLENYFESQRLDDIIITKGYSPDGKIFYSNRKFLDPNGDFIMELDAVLEAKE